MLKKIIFKVEKLLHKARLAVYPEKYKDFYPDLSEVNLLRYACPEKPSWDGDKSLLEASSAKTYDG